MTAYPDSRHLRTALERTRSKLGVSPDVQLERSEANVFLKHLLLEGLNTEACCGGHWAQSGLRQRLETLLDRLHAVPRPSSELASALRWLDSRSGYRSRVLDLAAEAVRGEPMAPEICLLPDPLEPGAALPPGGRAHAVVFAASGGFAHEFYPLAVDAYARDAMRGDAQPLGVLGVHADWLDTDGAIRRAILLDTERNRLFEADWTTPFRPHSVQFLSLGRRERELHRALATRFACPVVNPKLVSERADDKAATLTGWVELGLDVPRSRRVASGEWNAARRFAERFAESVIKPNASTEGFGVSYVSQSDPQWESVLTCALDTCWRLGTGLVQERRDGVLFRDPERGSTHTLVLRLNLAFDGQRHRLTSGFAQIGVDPSQPASCGLGGHIRTLAEVLSHLVARRDVSRSVPGPDPCSWGELAHQAERAAGLFEDLLLVGLDVLLDLDERGRLTPVFLEANPRPAGLCHARLLSGLPSRDDQAGVGIALWEGLGARQHPFPSGRQEARAPAAMAGAP